MYEFKVHMKSWKPSTLLTCYVSIMLRRLNGWTDGEYFNGVILGCYQIRNSCLFKHVLQYELVDRDMISFLVVLPRVHKTHTEFCHTESIFDNIESLSSKAFSSKALSSKSLSSKSLSFESSSCFLILKKTWRQDSSTTSL